MKTPLAALALLLALAAPALAVDWGHSTDEQLTDAVRASGTRMTDRAFQSWLYGVNRTHQGQRVVRTGWVVEAYVHPSIPNHTTVLVSNRVDRAGVTWTLYAPTVAANRFQPGDQIEWEGTIQKVAASGEVTLANERILTRLAPGQPAEAWPMGWAGRRADPPWYFQSLAERPIVRRVAPPIPAAAIREGVFANPVVRVWVAPTGFVTRADLAHSSGRADVDGAVIDAVRQWRFQPFPAGRAEDQIGEITVPIKAF